MLDGQLGWIEDNGSWYYLFLNGQKAKRWEKITGEWYYFYDDGSMAWGRTIEGYYLDIHGKCISREGWQKDENEIYYYVGPNEKAVTGWNRIDGEFYYFYSNGSMTYSNTVSGFYLNSSGKVSNGTGWLQDGMTGDWYYYSDGEASNGWIQDDSGSWYYTDDYGRMVTGWKNVDGDWYYFYSDGEMATGWVNDNGAWYFLYDNGSMAHNDTEGGYHVDLSGKMVTGSGWIHVDSWWYYLDDTGKVINNWLYDEGNWYYLYPEGSMAKGWIEDGDSWYYLNNDGSMEHNTKIDGYYVNDDGEWIPNMDNIYASDNSDTNNSQDTSNSDTDRDFDLYQNGEYDREAAVAYATNPEYSSQDKNSDSIFNWKKHTRNYNHDYERYDSYEYYEKGHLSGSDCANFVSQALYSGGMKQTDNWYFKWDISVKPYEIITKDANATASWIRPEKQLDYLKDKGYINGQPIDVNSPEEANNDIIKYGIQKGDIIYLKNNSEGLHHAMIITEITNGKIYISAHSNDHINAEYDSNYFQDGDIGVIVRIK